MKAIVSRLITHLAERNPHYRTMGPGHSCFRQERDRQIERERARATTPGAENYKYTMATVCLSTFNLFNVFYGSSLLWHSMKREDVDCIDCTLYGLVWIWCDLKGKGRIILH